jgi:hypothetical protein
MTKKKVMAIIGIMVLIIGATSIMALAAPYSSPAEAAAALTGKTVDTVVTERFDSGKTYGAIAKDAGKLEEFRKEMLEMKKAVLKEKVKDGTITQKRADEIITFIENNQMNCDGSGCGRIGEGMGIGFGRMNGHRQGGGLGNGQGFGKMRCGIKQ